MDFLRLAQKRKIIRTTLYGDQEFSRWELEILHTPIVQRLYDLKQLGFTDRVYPDAVHSRFNHVLGATEMAERMAGRLLCWLGQPQYANTAFEYPQTPGGGVSEITAPDLAELLSRRIEVVRLLALLRGWGGLRRSTVNSSSRHRRSRGTKRNDFSRQQWKFARNSIRCS